MEEIWKDIKDYEGKYQVSNLGRVRSLYRYRYNINTKQNDVVYETKILNLNFNNRYAIVNLLKTNKRKSTKVHVLVFRTFNPNYDKNLEINHIDGNRYNNKLNNLEQCNHKENMLHSYRIGIHKKLIGSNHGKSKKILQYDKQDNFIKEWESINLAQQKLNINHSHIIQCCKRIRKTAGGYIWKYKDAE